MPIVAQVPATRSIFNRKDLPSNPKMAMEIFLDLVRRQKDQGSPVFDSFVTAIRTNVYSRSTGNSNSLTNCLSHNLENS